LRPFELTAALCEMHWLAPVILYAARRQGKAMLHEQAQAYCDWLRAPQLTGGRKNGAN
ncbi:glutathione-regulated potassium-efflux system ancillary protein KefG, partial [Klebsiella pneumoniae]|nr:glutathione-regulated potassium-efflux system ancillary protein KefG [Klebsiella pneumoniae]